MMIMIMSRMIEMVLIRSLKIRILIHLSPEWCHEAEIVGRTVIGDHDHREDDCDDTNSSSGGFALHLSSMMHSSVANEFTNAGIASWRIGVGVMPNRGSDAE